ncbi:MAG: hypothetical protein PHO62_07920 [Sulfurimonas sp.]|uniref:hypothetical protein n=1 Tax=Sulfurimonas sp. TaxID=2022749 RepID=UPI0026127E2B|nr:hypothetical protein [Sulfurimonas sp.]MDD5373334.1 hypothetical protein [Sulfurimonas sp.]
MKKYIDGLEKALVDETVSEHEKDVLKIYLAVCFEFEKKKEEPARELVTHFDGVLSLYSPSSVNRGIA